MACPSRSWERVQAPRPGRLQCLLRGAGLLTANEERPNWAQSRLGSPAQSRRQWQRGWLGSGVAWGSVLPTHSPCRAPGARSGAGRPGRQERAGLSLDPACLEMRFHHFKDAPGAEKSPTDGSPGKQKLSLV